MQARDSDEFEEFARNSREWINDAMDDAIPHSNMKHDFEYSFDSGSAEYRDPFYHGKEPPRDPRQAPHSFGARPKHWPPHMTWPPASVREAMEAMTPAERDEVIKGLRERSAAMRLRSKQIHEWLVQRGSSPKLKRPADHASHGVMFASLLSPKGVDSSLSSTVLSWGHTRVTTQDGGIVAASERGIRAIKASQQAALVLVMEARARGWDSIDVTGTREFKRMVATAAQQYGIPVYSRNLLGRRTIIASGMMPPPPDAEFKRGPYHPEKDPGAPAARRKAGTLEVLGGAAAAAALAATSEPPRIDKPRNRLDGPGENDSSDDDPHGPHSPSGYRKTIDHDPDEVSPRPDDLPDPGDVPPPLQF
jgi:hypothetical protein